ncbi:MAG: 30S ribosomal protein S26e [Crenarchaeota archaeon]|nr:30S ribosomal protein S26e [Thermoproteota archaeon]MCR8453882.1 30S ribosomal protein S26e [Thermoproteota archaeon]MCR8455299.1 30S ribosomal protein S26e [Thermoproteota archaeon]MCR8462569.1 30S ribosomal protein S26e [Thermoproteota archaeon]MCR8470703.1 30S ribosomal protein S26e [Thermoproteota archaeon]
MPHKRKNRGRKKGKDAGHVKYVHCTLCHARVPADKAVKRVYWGSPIAGAIAKELTSQGTLITNERRTVYYCIRCAMFHGIVKIRPRDERKKIPEEILEKRFRSILGA